MGPHLGRDDTRRDSDRWLDLRVWPDTGNDPHDKIVVESTADDVRIQVKPAKETPEGVNLPAVACNANSVVREMVQIEHDQHARLL